MNGVLKNVSLVLRKRIGIWILLTVLFSVIGGVHDHPYHSGKGILLRQFRE